MMKTTVQSNARQMSKTAEAFVDYIRNLHLPRYHELPDIELYMDQVLTYTDNQLRPLIPTGEKLLTSSMVNNYVKQKLVPVPHHKRYTRDHLAFMITICLMKRTVSIADIRSLFAMQAASSPTDRAYDFFCAALEESLRALFCATVKDTHLGSWEIERPEGFAFALSLENANELTPEHRLIISAATAAANKIFIEKCLEFEQLEARN